MRPAEPRPIGEARELPFRPQLSGRAWIWIERPSGKPSRLIRCIDRQTSEIASNVSVFDATDSAIVWSTQENGRSKLLIQREAVQPQALHESATEIGGVKLSGETVCWLEKRPGIEPSSPLPPLADSTELWAVPASGGGPRRVATLMEPEPGQILGVRGEEVIISTRRPGSPGVTTIYAVNSESGAVRRLAGDIGRNTAALTDSGEVCWAAPSRESSEPSDTCVRCVDSSARTTTRLDWLGPDGQLFSSGDRAYYVDNEPNPAAWAADSGGALPQSLKLPAGYGVAGISRGKALLFRRSSGDVKLYEAGLP